MTQSSQRTTARPKLDDEAFEAFIRARRPASPIWAMSVSTAISRLSSSARSLSTHVSGSRS